MNTSPLSAASTTTRRRTASRWLLLATIATLPASLLAQGTIRAEHAVFEHNSFSAPVDGGDNADLRVEACAIDHLFQHWWWFRVAGDSLETQFRDPDTASFVGSTMTLGWTNVDGLARFDATLTATITPGATGDCDAIVDETLTITNTTGAPLTVDVFSYTDFDLTDSPFDDTAAAIAAGAPIVVRDGDTEARVSSPDYDHYQVGDTQATGATIRGLLTDGVVDNLADTGLPFGPPSEDFEMALQWSGRIAPVSGSFAVTQTLRARFHRACSSAAPHDATAWWRFDGNANDSAGTHHGTLTGGATTAAGPIGGALQLDGDDDYVTVPDAATLDFASQVTIAGWIRSTGCDSIWGWCALAGKSLDGWAHNFHYGLIFNTAGQMSFIQGNGVNAAFITYQGPMLFDGDWHHVATTYDGATVRYYVDGGEIYSAPNAIPLTPNAHALEVGSESGDDAYFDGEIDEMMVVGRALSATEVRELMGFGWLFADGFESGELCRWTAAAP